MGTQIDTTSGSRSRPRSVVALNCPAFRALDDPQLRARGFFEPVEHPLVGEQEYPGWPMRFSAGPDRYWRDPAPLLGQHTDAVLAGELGVDRDELARLRGRRVIGDEPLMGG